MEKTEVRTNLPYTLKVLSGHWAEQGTMSREVPEEELIGSETEPIKVGEHQTGGFENGTGFEETFYLIVQGGRPIVIKQVVESHNYGCTYMKNGGSAAWEVYLCPIERGVKTI